MTWLFIATAFLIILAMALALAGRWRPEGIAAGRPVEDAPGDARFDVVLRGYRMDQVDAELARLRGMLAAPSPEPAEPFARGGEAEHSQDARLLPDDAGQAESEQ